MTPEQTRCIQIGEQRDPDGRPIVSEYLFTDENGRVFTIEVVGIPMHPSLMDIEKEKTPPLAVPAGMLNEPGAVCKFILSAPFNSIRNHLVEQINPPEE